MVDGLYVLELLWSLDALQGMEFPRAQFGSFVLLAVCPTEDDDLAAHVCCELDGEMAKATNANDADSVRGSHAIGFECVEDGGSGAHQGRGVFVWDGVRDPKEVGFAPDGVGGEGAEVEVAFAVHDILWAERLLSCQALLAVAAAVVEVSEADTITSVKGGSQPNVSFGGRAKENGTYFFNSRTSGPTSCTIPEPSWPKT